MYNLRKLQRKEIKKIYALLKNQFGFDEKLDYFFLINNRNKVFIVNKEITKLDISNLKVNSIGLYFAELRDDGIRLSVEGSQLIGPKAEKNIVDLDDRQLEKWLKGEDIEMKGSNAYIIIRHNSDFIGCGKQVDGKILNFLPKSRRIKSLN